MERQGDTFLRFELVCRGRFAGSVGLRFAFAAGFDGVLPRERHRFAEPAYRVRAVAVPGHEPTAAACAGTVNCENISHCKN